MCRKLQFVVEHHAQASDIVLERYIHAIKGDGIAFHFDELLSGTQQNELSFVRV